MLCNHCKCENNQHLFNCETLEKKDLVPSSEEGVYAFRGENRFLSNFYKCEVEIFGVKCPTTEHAYQAAKTEVPSEREEILKSKTAAESKKLGSKATVRVDWGQIKLGIMENLLRQKFAKGTDLLEKLKNIKGEIVEGNWWHDNFYGVCACDKCGLSGRNELGKLLMKIRDESLKEG